jgi:hypothetical protein
MAKTKIARKQVAPRATVAPLDKNDPRVRAVAAEIFEDAVNKIEAQRAEREAKHRASQEQETKKQTKKRVSVKEVVGRLGRIAEPLLALHDTADQSLGNPGGQEAALIVASNLAMICLKRLDDCLVDLGNTPIGSADAWLAGETY